MSVVVPTWNSARTLERCLASLQAQTHARLEVIVVDAGSSDRTAAIAETGDATVFTFSRPGEPGKLFGATHQRNYGMSRASGDYLYYLDADMYLPPTTIEECVRAATSGTPAVIVPEDSIGVGYWARCKQLERRTYWGDDLIEAPRFFERSVWEKLGGLDESVAGGGDDWDLTKRARDCGIAIGRITAIALHDEGDLRLASLARKRFRYGKEVRSYLSAQRGYAARQFLFRASYLRQWRLFARNPALVPGFLFMRAVEYTAGGLGFGLSLLTSRKTAQEGS